MKIKFRKWETLVHESTAAHIDTVTREAWVEHSGDNIMLTFEQVAELYKRCYPAKLDDSCKISVEAPNPHGDDDFSSSDDVIPESNRGVEFDPESGLFI